MQAGRQEIFLLLIITTLTFGLINCRDVLTKLASDFGVEFYLKNKEINFVNHIENKTGLVFSQGKGKGLYTVSPKERRYR